MKRLKLTRRTALLGATAVLLLAGLLGWQWYRLQPVPPQNIPISQALSRVENGEISEATVQGNQVLLTGRKGELFRTTKEDEAAVVDLLRRNGVEVTVAAPEASSVPALGFALLPLLVIAGVFFLTSRQGGTSTQMFSFGRSRARKWTDDRPLVTFSDVAGVEEAKTELQEVVQFLRNPHRFKALGARIPRGVLLVGPPGTGKTLISRAVAGEAGVSFFSVSGSEFVEMFVGVGASRVRDLFRQAKRSAPCIVFIDEIDAVGRHRHSGATGGNDEREQTLNQLLVEMDGFEGDAGVVVIAATNRPDILDGALLRPGRFDRQVTLEAPDLNGRRAILEVHSRGKPLAEEVDLGGLAAETPGFSGADLANLINEAAILAARREKEDIGQPELEEAILRVLAGPERKSHLMNEQEKALIAYHEVGHALVMKKMPHADPVQKVSIISRGKALGLTLQRPKEDRTLITRSQLKARLAAMMGGRVSEDLVFDDLTTGARQDIAQATDLARRMVSEFGMNDLGGVDLTRETAHGKLSEAMAARVDQEVMAVLEEATETARRILTENHRALDRIARRLIKVETINGEELDALLAEELGLEEVPVYA